MTIINKGFHQLITRKYAFVPRHRRKFPALFHLKLRFETGGPVHYLILKKKYITMPPQVLNRVYSFNFQLHFKLYRFSRQLTTVFPGPLSMDKQVNARHGSALSTDISQFSHISHISHIPHIPHIPHISNVTWIQHALRAISQIDRFHQPSDTQTTPPQEYAVTKETLAGAGFPRPDPDASLAYLFPHQHIHMYPRSNSNSYPYLYPHRYTGTQDTAFPIFQGSTLTGIERETFEKARKLISKSIRDHIHKNDRYRTFNTVLGGTISRANTRFAPTFTTFTASPASFVGARSVFAFAPMHGGTAGYPVPAPVTGTTVFEKEKLQMARGLISKSHTDHIHRNDRSGIFNTFIGGTQSRANTRFAPTFTTFTHSPASFVGARYVFVSALMHGGTAGYPVPPPAPGTTVFEKEKFQEEKYQLAREIISKSHTDHIHTNNRSRTFNTFVGGTQSRANTRFAPTFTTFTASTASFVGARSVFLFAPMYGGTAGYPIPAPAAGTTVFENEKFQKEKYQMMREIISKSHTDHIHTNDRSGTFNTFVGGTQSRVNTRFAPTFTMFTTSPETFVGARSVFVFALTPLTPRSIVFSLSKTTSRAPVLSPAKSEFFQTVTKRMDTTLSTVRNRQTSELTTLHFTSGTSGPGETRGKTGPKPVNLPQLDYFTPVGTFQPKTETSLAEREETTVTTPGTGLMSNTVTDHTAAGKIPAIPGINSAAVSNPQEGGIDFDRLTDQVYRMLEDKIRTEKEMRGW